MDKVNPDAEFILLDIKVARALDRGSLDGFILYHRSLSSGAPSDSDVILELADDARRHHT